MWTRAFDRIYDLDFQLREENDKDEAIPVEFNIVDPDGAIALPDGGQDEAS